MCSGPNDPRVLIPSWRYFATPGQGVFSAQQRPGCTLYTVHTPLYAVQRSLITPQIQLFNFLCQQSSSCVAPAPPSWLQTTLHLSVWGKLQPTVSLRLVVCVAVSRVLVLAGAGWCGPVRCRVQRSVAGSGAEVPLLYPPHWPATQAL